MHKSSGHHIILLISVVITAALFIAVAVVLNTGVRPSRTELAATQTALTATEQALRTSATALAGTSTALGTKSEFLDQTATAFAKQIASVQATQTAIAGPTVATPPTISQNTFPDKGICLFVDGLFNSDDENERTKYTGLPIKDHLNAFPAFPEWCPGEGIRQILKLGADDMVSFKIPDAAFKKTANGLGYPATLYIMLTGSNSKSEPEYGSKVGTVQLNQEQVIPLRIGQQILPSSLDTLYKAVKLPFPEENRYWLFWSGYDKEKQNGVDSIVQKAVQVGYLALPVEDVTALTKITIKTEPDSELEIYGLLFKPPMHAPNTSTSPPPTYTSLCDGNFTVSLANNIRPLPRAFVVLEDKLAMMPQIQTCDSSTARTAVPPPSPLLLPGSLPATIPVTIWENFWETRPKGSEPDDTDTSPKIVIQFTTPITGSDVLYLTIAARNLCSPSMSNNSRERMSRMGSIQVYYRDGTRSDPSILDAGVDVRQGRSGIEACLDGSGRDLRFFDKNSTAILGAIAIAAARSDTNRENVALWLDVLKIKTDRTKEIERIEIVDNSLPEKKLDSTATNNIDNIDYSDPYLTLYGITIERQANPR